MSMVTQLIAAVNDSEVELRRQMEALTAYDRQLGEMLARIEAVEKGSTVGYDKEMAAQIVATRKKVQETVQVMQGALKSLAVIRNI